MFHLEKNTKIENLPSEKEHHGDNDYEDDDSIDGDNDGNDGGQELITPHRGLIPAVEKMSDFDTPL